MSESESTAELFDRHGAFVRRVARELCRDDADADDLAQDTWAEALRRPPARWSSPRGWLARVARRLAAKRGRGERRRAAREASVARAEAMPGRADHALVLQDLVTALVELDEPLRRLVVARHFEGLELAAIARREGLSVTTVKMRLRGAHERLRSRLDEGAGGDRRAWLAALAPFAAPEFPWIPAVPRGAPRPLLPLAAGAALVGMKLQLALAASVVALAAVGIFRWSDSKLGAPSLPEGGTAAHAADVAGLEASAPRESARAPIGEPALTDDVSAAPAVALSTLTIVVTDLDGMPASGVEVFAAPPRQALNRIGGTDADGRVELHWRGASRVRELVVALRSKGAWLGGLRRLEVPAGATRTLRVAAEGALLPDPMHSLVSGVVLRMGGDSGNFRFAGNVTLDMIVEAKANDEEDQPARARTGGLLPGVRQEDAGGLAFVAGGRNGRNDRLQGLQVVNWSMVAAEDKATARVEGIVRDLTGRPAGGVRVSARAEGEDAGGSSSTRTNSSGGFELDVLAGKIVVEVADPELGGEELRLDLTPEGRHVWEPYIDRGLTLFGEVHDAADGPLVEALVEATCATPEGMWLAIAQTDETGKFVLPRCPAPLMTVEVLRPGNRNGLPVLRVGAVALGGEPWEFVVPDGAAGTVAGNVRDEAPESPLASEVRVWDAERLRGVRIPLRNRAGEPASAPVPPGRWLVSVGAQSSHWSNELAVDVVAEEKVDLGEISLGPTGWLELPDLSEAEHWRVDRTARDWAPMEVYVGPGTPLAALPLPPGTYRVQRLGDEAAVLAEHEVEVRVARKTTLEE